MKKTFLYKFLFFVSFLILGYVNVFADEEILICDYNGGNKNVQVFYQTDGDWAVKYTEENSSNLKLRKEGDFQYVFADKGSRIYVNEKEMVYSANISQSYTCKENAFIDYWYGDDKLCFTNNAECRNFKGVGKFASLNLNHSTDTPFTYINNQNPVDIIKSQYSNYKEFAAADKIKGVQDHLYKAVADKYGLETAPQFLRTYIDEKLKEKNSTYESEYAKLVEGFIQEANNDPNATEAEKKALQSEKSWGLSQKASASTNNNNNNANASGGVDYFDHNCLDAAKVIRIVGFVILVVKIAIPLIIIFKGSLHLFSTLTKGSQDELKKAMKKIGVSIVAGVAIFVTPTIMNAVFSLVGKYNGHDSGDFAICEACVFDPLSDTCSAAADDESRNPYAGRIRK